MTGAVTCPECLVWTCRSQRMVPPFRASASIDAERRGDRVKRRKTPRDRRVTATSPPGHEDVTPGSDASAVEAMDGSADEPEVLLLIVDAGGGHRSAANALLAAAKQARPCFRLRVESLQSILASLDPIRRLSGRSIEDVYNGL